ncbi:DUF3726 domain-containing protein [Pseudomonas moorei]|uniref:DUF3726 domain-containing protein n=1 Tax=Pseudomonas moorei TaxID=395599 RepID=UPI001FF17C4A
MNASLNEIESMCKKAARGAGMSWGLAEEAGKAAKWLSAHGLNGPQLLAEQLRHDDGVAYRELAPVVCEGTWHGSTLPMCPLIAGATLSDHAHLLNTTGQILLSNVSCPQLLIPFVSGIATRLKRSLELSWPGCTLFFDSRGEVFLNNAEGLGQERAASVCCTHATAPDAKANALEGPIPAVARPDLAYLEALAYRTYVPSSESSRLLGAGAGLSDNN